MGGALKRYRSLGGSGDEFFKFSEENPVLEGIWRGTQKGKFGENGVIETPDGVRHIFTLSTMLRDLLKVPEGVGVKVSWLGMGLSKAGNQFHRFQILVEEGESGGEGDPPF